ncbi:MAG: hypothetical protein HS116_11435 [Planctomycetes bacterium]|nr:hypothetical protein [Planctomycetota bacterium]
MNGGPSISQARRRRLDELDARPGLNWREALERQVLTFLNRRHRHSAPSQAEPLDAAGAEEARRLKLSDQARERLRAPGDSRLRAERGFRADDELESIELHARRQKSYRHWLERRSGLLALFFLLLVVLLASAYTIVTLLN